MATRDIPCPIAGCEYTTGDVEIVIAAAYLQIHATTHSKHPNANKPKILPPTIPIGCTTENFTYLKSRWEQYKTITELNENQHATHLLNCCEDDLQRALYRVHQEKLKTLSEQQMLTAIETLAVRLEKKIVARVRLLSMCQDRGQPIREFAAKIQGQAGICKYTKSQKCTAPGCEKVNIVDYSDDIVQDVIARGLSDQDIQLELLGNINQDLSLEETIQFIATKEAGKASATHISSQSTNAIRSTYKRTTNIPPVPTKQTTKYSQHVNKSKPQNYTHDRHKTEIHCRNCGNHGHRGPGSGICPAYGKTCNNCKIMNHFTHMCRRERNKNTATASVDDESDEILTAAENSDLYFHGACSASIYP